MSDTKKKDSKSAAFRPESQGERRVKYGAAVALTVFIALALLAAVLYISRDVRIRKDTTAGGVYSLKPQTVKLVESLPQKVKLVGLFTKARHEEQEKKVDDDDNPAVRYQQVADLLQEYQQKSGGKVTVEMIDPITEPAKVDQLFNDVAKKYGNDVNKYNEVIKAYPKAVEEIDKVAKEEIAALRKLPPIRERKIGETLQDVMNTVGGFPPLLQMINAQVKKQLELKVPDYKGAVDAVKMYLGNLSEDATGVLGGFKTLSADAATPQPIKDYIVASTPRIEALKKSADEVLKMTENLGQLKQLDDLRLNKSNSVAVMAEGDMKVLPSTALYPTEDARFSDPGAKARQRFAGEQQVTTALYTLTNPAKRKVAFIRSGGEPLATRIMQYAGPFTTVADRLRELDFEVLEKDVSGAWAMQAMQLMQQGMPVPPEPSDQDLKGATWIVFNSPQDPRQMMQNPAAGQMAPKVAEHLKNGGSALILVNPNADNFGSFLKDWGIETKPEYIMVHEKIAAGGARSADTVGDFNREQPVFLLNDYGNAALARPIQSLDGFFVPVVPISTKPAAGIKTTNLLPIPSTPKAWAERDVNSVYEGKPVEFNPAKDGKDGDLDQGPFHVGATAENDKGDRLVVIGCGTFALDRWVRQKDPQNRSALRFPGNGELFVNSVFWLAKMDTMIAISPTALEVPRVAPMSDGLKRGWQMLLVIGLPALVLAAGASVYMKRRD